MLAMFKEVEKNDSRFLNHFFGNSTAKSPDARLTGVKKSIPLVAFFLDQNMSIIAISKIHS